MSVIDVIIGLVVVVPWNLFLIIRMKKENAKR